MRLYVILVLEVREMNKSTSYDGKFYNKFGSLVFPRMSRWKKTNTRKYTEFEIHAVAYCALRNFYKKDDSRVKGEFTLQGGCGRCDIAIFNKLGILTLIVEVKKNKREAKISQGQILSYERIAPVYVLDNISDAEKIISILLTKKLIST
jgi:hypothetical protein